MKKYLIAGLVALFAAFGAQAQTVHYNGTDDTVPAFKIWNGYDNAMTIAITGGGTGFVVTVDSNANTINGDGATDTVAELVPLLIAVTNAANEAKLVVDASYALGADSTDGELLSGVYTGAAGSWLSIPWDTSAAKFYQVAIPSRDPKFDRSGNEIRDGKIPAVSFSLNRVYGQPTGTGAATLKVYVDGAEKYSESIPEAYELGAGGTNVLNSTITFSRDLGIPVGAQDSVIVRASRATTAAGGNIGFIAE